MNKRTFTVNITHEDSTEMEKIWYEYNAAQNNIAFLMKDPGVIYSILDEYIKVSHVLYTKCEMTKAALAKKYKPSEVDLNSFNYGFNFDDECIQYTEA